MRLGKPRRGEEHPLARSTNSEAAHLRARYRRGEVSIRDLQRETGRAYETIRRMVNGHSYSDD